MLQTGTLVWSSVKVVKEITGGQDGHNGMNKTLKEGNVTKK